jgi:DNA-binding MarR family transcriptional regulator
MLTTDLEFARRVMLLMAESGHGISAAIRELPDGDILADNVTLIVLSRLHETESLRPMELQQSLDLTSGGLSKVIDRLEEAGLVARLGARPSGDLRGVQIAITRKGGAALLNLLETAAPQVKHLVADLELLAAGVEEAQD